MSGATARLAPGVHVVRRDDDHVQVGLDPPARVVVRRDERLLGLLDELRHGVRLPVDDPARAGLVRALTDAGLLVGPAPDDAAGPATPTVRLVDRGLGIRRLDTMLRRAGVGPDVAGVAPDLVVLASAAPVPRAVLDDWVADGTPHLLLAGPGRPGALRLGPLVEPGLTACLRCVDAAEAVDDPRRPLVVEQLACRPAPLPGPGVLDLALAWAAREAAAYIAGRRPLTWSGTVDLDEGADPVVRSWPRHPHCGCAWTDLPY
ncbi:hypothetical protein [Nocardioides litoris]|uniref:hypothetical protein n=1 Tax=Nocardioides litoris TaxID=1926648 RepID=UPI00112274E4|nr:hypothetical protein [Nocardioides litoris]